MKRLTIIAAILLMALGLLGTKPVPDTITYEIDDGASKRQFTVPVYPVPDTVLPDIGFQLTVLLSPCPNGNPCSDTMTFYNAASDGCMSDLYGYNLFGPAMYSGTDQAPHMLTGRFVCNNGAVIIKSLPKRKPEKSLFQLFAQD